jgi:rhodanese-related sulfurtransferase
MKPPRQIDANVLADTISARSAPTILDVRTAGEYRRGHIPGAVHMPFWLLPFRAQSLGFSGDDPVVVYCGHGPRAQFARAVLERHGYQQVMLLTGHMQAWRKARLPEVRED